MNIGCDANTDNIIVDQKLVENVEQFQYLGSIITNDGDVEIDISKISLKIKLQLYNSIVLPPATYACEKWKTPVKLYKKLNAFHQRCLRKILKITYLDRVKNE